jgi:hypothetical protein
MGVSKTLGFSLGIIDHFTMIYAVIPGGIFYVLDKDTFYKDIKSENRLSVREFYLRLKKFI